MFSKIAHLFIFGTMLFICSFCSPSRIVQPLQKGESQVGLHLGGPMIRFAGAPLPIPLTSLSYARGIDSTFTAFGGIGLTAAAFGVAQVDLGCTKGLWTPKGARPGVSVSPSLNFMIDKWEGNFRFYPTLDVNAYWQLGKRKNTAYIGLNNWFVLNATRTQGEPQTTRYIPNLQVGYVIRRKGWNYTIEAKYLAPFNDNVKLVPDYISAGTTGAFGIYFNVGKTF